MKGNTVVAKNRSFTGGRHSVGTPTLNKEQYFQLIRMIRNEKKEEPPTRKEEREDGKEYETITSYHKERKITNG